MGSTYKQKIYEIAVNIFEVTCYMFPLEEWEIEEIQDKTLPEDGIRSLVHFTGAAEGQMIITPSDELLTAMAANMLGIENSDKEQKSGALCEIANIICGNTVPLFASNDNICYIQPPGIITDKEELPNRSQEMHEESVRIYLDEGTVEITIQYILEEEL